MFMTALGFPLHHGNHTALTYKLLLMRHTFICTEGWCPRIWVNILDALPAFASTLHPLLWQIGSVPKDNPTFVYYIRRIPILQIYIFFGGGGWRLDLISVSVIFSAARACKQPSECRVKQPSRNNLHMHGWDFLQKRRYANVYGMITMHVQTVLDSHTGI